MKKCSRCKLEFEEYYENKKTEKLASCCKECKRIYDREYYKKRPDTRKYLKYEQQKIRREILRKWIFELLVNSYCIDCGERNPLVLDFDHRGDKEFNISEAMQGDVAIDRVKKETEKCDIRCANCHRIKTASQLNNWKVSYIIENQTQGESPHLG